MSTIDPDLIGIWIIPGEPATYEVMSDGSYHVADPEEPLSFEDGGATMVWGPRRHMRLDGSGKTPVGKWREAASRDEWVFERDGSYSVTGQGNTDTGIWALRSGGTALWTRELNAQLSSNGAQVTFTPVSGGSYTFGYTVADGVWTLLDANDWTELARYVSPSAMAKTG